MEFNKDIIKELLPFSNERLNIISVELDGDEIFVKFQLDNNPRNPRKLDQFGAQYTIGLESYRKELRNKSIETLVD